MKTIEAKQSDKVPGKAKRSNHWPKVRKEHLEKNPTCAVCGGNKKLEVHHIRPFHLHPNLELEPTNFVTLCENMKEGINCHLLFGHLGNFKSFNVNVLAQAKQWHDQIVSRPLSEEEADQGKKAA
jgi:5-methylcytosine-specific restriction protein A